ncbi:MAG: hypothetical protein AMXMBFR4_23420 [Candidatus Hydrogenedentota bacterium]
MKLGYRIAYVGLAVLLAAAEAKDGRVRPSTAEGLIYPADPAQLRAAVEQYVSAAQPLNLPGPVVGCIVPHSPYSVTGGIMGEALARLQPGQYARVIVLAPSLHADFRGCSVPSVQYYQTPLGDVKLDTKAIRRITINSLIQIRSLIYRGSAYTDPQLNRTPIHERETAIEAVLPFLQVRLGEFELVPIVVGSLHRVHGGLDETALNQIARTLADIVDNKTLVIACSDFTRYGAVHNFTPFTKDIPRSIAALDHRAFRLIERRDVTGFAAYLDETKSTITGPLPIMLLMKLMPRRSVGVLVGYDMSSRISGKPDISVSYASLIFVDGTRPPPPDRSTTKTRSDPAGDPPAPRVGEGEPAVGPPPVTDATDVSRE